MFGCGLGPEIQKILRPLKNHASKSNDKGFQTVLVTSTVAKVWCNLSLVLMILIFRLSVYRVLDSLQKFQASKFCNLWLLFSHCVTSVIQNDRY